MGLAQSPLLDPIKAQIQAEVGEFLAAKAALYAARGRVRTPEDLLYIDELMARQNGLEAELHQVLPPIQAGEFSVANVAVAAGFAARLTQHMREVRDLKRRLRGLPEAAGIPWGTVVWYGGGALAVLLVFGMLRRR